MTTIEPAESQHAESPALPDKPDPAPINPATMSRLPMFVAVGVAAAVAVLGAVWFALRPIDAPAEFHNQPPSPYSPFANANKARGDVTSP